MINLLPPEEKQNLIEIRQQKIVVILGFTVFIFLVALALILASINVILSSKTNNQKVILASRERSVKTTDLQKLSKNIADANQELAALDSFYKNSPSFTVFLEKIANLLPEGISLNDLTINLAKKENNLFFIHLSGHAASVEEVNLLKENLEKDPSISQISFPLDTWLKKSDFIFSVAFEAIIVK
jgi:Tfp pilus assembly protein PilN